MTEEQNQAENEELAAPAIEEVTQATDALAEMTQEHEGGQETDQERNWRAMREREEQLRLENEELNRRAREAEAQAQAYAQFLESQKMQAQPQAQEPSVDPDEWMTHGEFERKWQEREQQRQMQELPNRIKSAMPDFEAVVNEENVKKLRASDPEVAAALSEIKDPYKQAVAAYKYMQAYLPKETPANRQAKERIAKNAEKPGSLGSVGGGTPLAQSGQFERGLTPELKAHLWAEMNEAASRA